jgi:hypothetical protein
MKITYRFFVKKTGPAKIILLIAAAIIIICAANLIIISGGKTISSLPHSRSKSLIDNVYVDLTKNKKNINWAELEGEIEYISKQYDVADFRLAILLRIMNDYKDRIPPELNSRLKKTLLGFRYWMDEPGENGMCYWSENHQILFASAEYIAGQMYPDEVFTNSGLTGRQHIAKAEKRIFDWLEMRWKFGFSEFYSNVYYNEDIAGLINIIDYANNPRLVQKAKIITDLLMYDIASQKTGNMFVSVSGRLYERHRKGGRTLSSRRITDFVWNGLMPETPHVNQGFFTTTKYVTPPVLVEIGRDPGNSVIKQCNGLNLDQFKQEGYFGSDEKSIMMQWGMEAFTNPETVNNSIDYIRRNRMFSNEFIAEFRYYNFIPIRLLGLEKIATILLNPYTNGTAIPRANTYTYRTKYYSVYSVQNYNPGEYSCQAHVSGMNIDSSFAVFHTHPALYPDSENLSPGYWVGYGRLPHTAQDSSVSLSIYSIPAIKNITEKALPDFTHAWFPSRKFDSVVISGRYAFGAKGNAYCALIGQNNFSFADTAKSDLIQPGKKVFWIIEAGDRFKDGSFANFRKRIASNKINFDADNMLLKYRSNGKELLLKYAKDFYINGKKANTNYPRYDSPYIKAPFKPSEMLFKFNGRFLKLNFDKGERIYN